MAIADIVFTTNTPFVVQRPPVTGGSLKAMSFDGINILIGTGGGAGVYPIIGGGHIIRVEGEV